MPTSLVDADSLLAIDVGTVSTRALLFDVVEGTYRYLATGMAPTTAGAPYHNVSEGVRRAMDDLQNITGRVFVGADEQLIMPTTPDGSGVDTFAATISVGPPLKIIVVALLEDVSVDSARRLAMTTYGKVEQVISLNDRRKSEARIDTILRVRPNLVVVAGGTENGASQSVFKLLESVGLACYLMPKEERPEVFFVGNQALHDEVQASIEGITNVHFAPNIRPSLEVEQLEAAQSQIAQIYSRIRSRDILGVEELNTWAKGGLTPTATAFGRIIHFLSKTHATTKGVLGVDVGASATTVAAAFSSHLTIGVYPHLGLGSGLAKLLDHIPFKDIIRWLPLEISGEMVHEYILNKSLCPGSLPVLPEEMAIEQAVVRQLLQNAARALIDGLSASFVSLGEGLLPLVEPIIATGSVLTRAPDLAQSTLMLLDGLQPTGATTLVLDRNQVISSLGAAASINPVLAIQVLDSSSLLHLATVISPVGNARPDTPVLRLKMTYESGHETKLDVRQGALEVIPLPYGQTAQLQLQPLHQFDVGMGAPGRGGSLRIVGGALGVIIDARGRPLILPEDRSKRAELIQKWLWALGGQ